MGIADNGQCILTGIIAGAAIGWLIMLFYVIKRLPTRLDLARLLEKERSERREAELRFEEVKKDRERLQHEYDAVIGRFKVGGSRSE